MGVAVTGVAIVLTEVAMVVEIEDPTIPADVEHSISPHHLVVKTTSGISSCSIQYVEPTTIDTLVSPISVSPDICSNVSFLPKLFANFASPHVTLPLIVLVTSLLLPKLAPLQDGMLSPLCSLVKLTMLSGTLT